MNQRNSPIDRPAAGLYEESSDITSPQNPARPGSPSEAIATNAKMPRQVRHLLRHAAADLARSRACGTGRRSIRRRRRACPVITPCATMPKIAALMPIVGERGDAEHHEPHVPHRAERDQAFQVLLREAGQRRVHDARSRPAGRSTARTSARRRQHRQRDPDEAVRPHLQHDAGQQHRADRRRLGVGVGQPRVERPHRHLDGEPQAHRAEDDQLERVGEPAGRAELLRARRCRTCAGSDLEVHGQEAQQHEHATRTACTGRT